mmetsp:Transcript_88755/g.251543  ORF Transcript_88755/g.251543 Transcript_88755/m.251543 type:complete len:234 (+) Transcript_88755:652-1353(+)
MHRGAIQDTVKEAGSHRALGGIVARLGRHFLGHRLDLHPPPAARQARLARLAAEGLEPGPGALARLQVPGAAPGLSGPAARERGAGGELPGVRRSTTQGLVLGLQCELAGVVVVVPVQLHGPRRASGVHKARVYVLLPQHRAPDCSMQPALLDALRCVAHLAHACGRCCVGVGPLREGLPRGAQDPASEVALCRRQRGAPPRGAELTRPARVVQIAVLVQPAVRVPLHHVRGL